MTNSGFHLLRFDFLVRKVQRSPELTVEICSTCSFGTNARPVLSSAGVHLILKRDKSVLFTQQIGFVGSQDKSALAC